MDKRLKITAYVASIVGLLVSIYLTYTKLAKTQVYCGTSSQCETVNSSSYAVIAGVPLALIGLIAYIFIIGLLYFEGRSKIFSEYIPIVLFGTTLIGFIYSLYLTYLEIWVIRAICPYCVVSALALTAVFIVSIVHLVRVFK